MHPATSIILFTVLSGLGFGLLAFLGFFLVGVGMSLTPCVFPLVPITLAVIGAVVGEFVGADRGLGFLVNLGQGLLDTPLMFVAILLLVVIALGLYGLVSILEGWMLNWRS